MTASANRIPLCDPLIAGREWEYVKECLDTGWVSSVGFFVNRFEADLARAVSAAHAVAVVNGTSAIHIALEALGIGAGDEVVMPSLTFIAPANAVAYTGARPVFIDADPGDWQMSIDRLTEFLRDHCERSASGTLVNKTSGRTIRALLPVHILGTPCDMARLSALAAEFDLPIVEDATESLGATFAGQAAGTFGVAGCFSFNGNKLITCGGGGMFVTADESLARYVRHLTTQAKSSPDEYMHDEVGYNYRLTNVQAAIGCAQLERLDEFISRKRAIAAAYREVLSAIASIRFLQPHPGADSAEWLFTIQIEPSGDLTARGLREHLKAEGIQTRCLWEPLHMSEPYRGDRYIGTGIAGNLFDTCLSLPCSVGLTDDEQSRVIQSIGRFFA